MIKRSTRTMRGRMMKKSTIVKIIEDDKYKIYTL